MVRWLSALVAVLLLASLWYIQAPPRSVDAFEQRVAHTAEGLRSQVVMIVGFAFGLVIVASLAGTVGAFLIDDRREFDDRPTGRRWR